MVLEGVAVSEGVGGCKGLGKVVRYGVGCPRKLHTVSDAQ